MNIDQTALINALVAVISCPEASIENKGKANELLSATLGRIENFYSEANTQLRQELEKLANALEETGKDNPKSFAERMREKLNEKR